MSDEILREIQLDIKDIKNDINHIKVTQAGMQVDVAHHIKRSDANEADIKHLDEKKVQPLEQKMAELSGVYKFVMFLSLLATIGLAFIEYFKK